MHMKHLNNKPGTQSLLTKYWIIITKLVKRLKTMSLRMGIV